jgi:nucleotide-binding universal stress UspA family protein
MNSGVFPKRLYGALIADPYFKRRTGTRHMDEDTPQILVPIDFSSDSQPALEYAVGLARRQSSEIVLIHVVESLPHGVYKWCDPSDLHDQLAKNAKRHLECFEKRALDLYPHCRSEVHFGAPAQAIAARASTLKEK